VPEAVPVGLDVVVGEPVVVVVLPDVVLVVLTVVGVEVLLVLLVVVGEVVVVWLPGKH